MGKIQAEDIDSRLDHRGDDEANAKAVVGERFVANRERVRGQQACHVVDLLGKDVALEGAEVLGLDRGVVEALSCELNKKREDVARLVAVRLALKRVRVVPVPGGPSRASLAALALDTAVGAPQPLLVGEETRPGRDSRLLVRVADLEIAPLEVVERYPAHCEVKGGRRGRGKKRQEEAGEAVDSTHPP